MEQVRKPWLRLSAMWCSVMHNGTTWPIHGHYQCRKCRRVYSVPWERA